MVYNLKNKIAVVTGSAGGIGYGIADIFLQNEARVVVLLDINEKLGAEASNTLNKKYGKNKAPFIKCDVTKDREEVAKKILSTYGYVDVLVNNAGIMNERMSKRTIDINVLALIDWSLMFYEHMRVDVNGKSGTIINTSSIYGYRVYEFTPIYHASKFAVIGFTKSLGHANNFDKTGVRVVAICPGYTKTNATITNMLDDRIAEEFQNFVNRHIPQEVDAVAQAALEVYQNANSGTAWVIEGGKPITEV